MSDVKHNFARKRIMHAILILIIAFGVVYLIGIIGYRHYFNMSVSDAVFNTSLTVSNLGVGLHEKTSQEKVFTALYSLLAGIFFVSLVSSVVAYIFTIYLEGIGI